MKIAIIGGGITGSVIASELSRVFFNDDIYNDDDNCDNDNESSSKHRVVLFDQGRRGPGGRASHRSVMKKKSNNNNNDGTTSTEATATATATTTINKKEEEIDTDASDTDTLDEFIILPDDEPIDESSYNFDHGCQFFRIDSTPMKNLVETNEGGWITNGWVAPWKAKFGCLNSSSTTTQHQNHENENENDTHDGNNSTDFFGIPSLDDDVYIGVGGMHLLPRRILNSSKAIVHSGTRVSNVVRRKMELHDNDNTNSKKSRKAKTRFVWDVTTIVGVAAYHDTKESVATAAVAKAEAAMDNDATTTTTTTSSSAVKQIYSGFDIVIFTDISSSSDSWHRASAGGENIPKSFLSRLPTKYRLPLFSCMIALSKPLKHVLPFDAFTVATTTSITVITSTNAEKKKSSSSSSSQTKKATGSSSASPLWFAARSDSKPGFPSSSNSNNSAVGAAECWTLISTPAFAVNEIQQTTMRDPITGEFRPQENKYLNSKINGGPAHTLKDAFYDIVRCNHNSDVELELEEDPIYIQGQRWGSGLPIDPKRVDSNNINAPGNKNVKEICGTKYVANFNGSIVYNNNNNNSKSNNSGIDTNTNTNNFVNDDDDAQEEAEEVVNKNFVADDDLGLYYAGDFCSMLNPGFEAAALSGSDVAQHIITKFDLLIKSA